jgi:hypothetical protein
LFPFFWDITPRHWVIGSQLSETTSCFDTSGNDYPVQWLHIPEERNHHCENPKKLQQTTLSFYFDTESGGQVSSTQVVLGSYLGLNIAYPYLKSFLCLSRQN